MKEHDLTLLSEGQIWGNSSESRLEVIRKYGIKSAITDLCVLTGSYLREDTIDEDRSLTGRTSCFWTRSDDGSRDVVVVFRRGYRSFCSRYARYGAVRPALQSSVIFSQISPNRVMGYNGIEEVEYGEYPQNAADSRMQSILESEYNRGMNKTGRNYTFDSVKYDDYDTGFKPVTYEEYEYQGKKYIRIRANSDFDWRKFKLSNGVKYICNTTKDLFLKYTGKLTGDTYDKVTGAASKTLGVGAGIGGAYTAARGCSKPEESADVDDYENEADFLNNQYDDEEV